MKKFGRIGTSNVIFFDEKDSKFLGMLLLS